MTGPALTEARWASLLERSDEFTCYSAALATWLAASAEDWGSFVSPGLWLRITEAHDGLFGFAYFPPDLRTRLGLVRVGAADAEAAIAGVRAELERSGRVIIAGDGYRLPWHVAAGRHHVPHWFVLVGNGDGLEFADPFACRNELGVQEAARGPASEEALPELLLALPEDDPVYRLRETLALGDEISGRGPERYRWFVHEDVADSSEPAGYDGPEAVRRLARHFREHGQEPDAYRQADDIWSIGRHRAFHCRQIERLARDTGDEALQSWVVEHGAPLARKWSHTGPLMMQAMLALRAGRQASGSVPTTLEQLAELERAAAAADPSAASDYQRAALPSDRDRRQ
jgi:hypothetical protein